MFRLIRPILLLSIASVLVPSAFAQPRLVFETTAVDLGAVWEGEEPRAVYPLHNGGDEALRLKGG